MLPEMRLLATMAVLIGLLQAGPATAARERPGFHRGMVVSCPRAGEIWGSEAMVSAVERLGRLGVDSISIHPYGWVRRDGSIRFTPAAETGYLERSVRIVRDAGRRWFWKPHLGYWGHFAWRGAIEFGEDEAAWSRFFEHYRAFIVDQATFAEHHGIGLFAVGVELDATLHRESDWERVFEAVRKVYSGELVYAANWDAIERVPFWDAVDRIGVHAYFPLSESDDPTTEELRAAWDAPLARLEALAERHRKPVLIAEIGYPRSKDAARSPWAYGEWDGDGVRELRQRLLEAALDRLEPAPFVSGIYWWKWLPGGKRDFSMADPEAVSVLERRWAR